MLSELYRKETVDPTCETISPHDVRDKNASGDLVSYIRRSCVTAWAVDTTLPVAATFFYIMYRSYVFVKHTVRVIELKTEQAVYS